MKKQIRICLVEDDEEIRRLTKDVLELNGDILCVETCDSAEDFMTKCNYLEVDIVMMDIGLPGMSGIDCVKRCAINVNMPNFVMYTTHYDSHEVFDALKAGAKGYILKGGPPNRLIEDIHDMASGGSPMSPRISRLVTESFNPCNNNSDDLAKLTKQEREILHDLDKGLNYKEIANIRFISPHTVRAHIRSIYEKLHVHSKLDAIRMLQKNG